MFATVMGPFDIKYNPLRNKAIEIVCVDQYKPGWYGLLRTPPVVAIGKDSCTIKNLGYYITII